jgi:glycosyltransferase involved in cell wall biosynthesis
MDVFALPSRWEGTPLALIGAMAATVPVVATPVGGVTTVVEDGVTGRLVPVEDVPALTTALAGALQDQATSRRFAEAGRNRVTERSSVEAMVRELETLYLELLKKKMGNVERTTDN